MFRLRKHRAKLREMLIKLGIFKSECPNAGKLGHECDQHCDRKLTIVDPKAIKDEPFTFGECRNGTTRCLTQLRCFDEGKCLYGTSRH